MMNNEVFIDASGNIISANSAPIDNVEVHPKVQAFIDTPQVEQRSEEWYELRKQRLTASDVATALGFNPYQNRQDLVYKKSGGIDTFKGNAATKWGQKYEDVAIKIYEKKYNVHVAEFGLIPHPNIDMLAGSPDGIVKETATLIEVKCPLNREIIPGTIPDYYYPQVQVCMECMDLDECHFIQYRPAKLQTNGNDIFDVTIIQRNKEWFSYYFPVMKLFWDEVTHYRKIGVEHHPTAIKKTKPKVIKSKLTKMKDVKETPTYLFEDSD